MPKRKEGSKDSMKTDRLSLLLVPVERDILDQIMVKEGFNQSEAIRYILRWYAREEKIEYSGVQIVED